MNWNYKNYKISVDINGLFTFNDGKQDIKCPTLKESKEEIDNLYKIKFYEELVDFLDSLNPESFSFSTGGFGTCNELYKYKTLFPILNFGYFNKRPEFYTYKCYYPDSSIERGEFLVISTEIHESGSTTMFKGILISKENMAKIVNFLENSLKKYDIKPFPSPLDIINSMDEVISIMSTDFHNKVIVKGRKEGRTIKILADVTQLGELGKGIY